jgi:isocitrate dehydrogenase
LTARLIVKDSTYSLTDTDIVRIIEKISPCYRWNHIEKLNVFDGKLGYTKSHGEE